MNILYQHLNKKYGFIYLSNSEMNLYPLIKNFLKKYQFPGGPLFLREHKRWPHFLTGRSKYFSKQEHKLSTLKLLLETFPDKKVVLVGDSGQRDPETYAMVAKIFPSQIERIFIREIRPGHRSKKLALIHAELERLGVHFEVFHSGNNLLTY
jgi:phosphatidate phosphatase APP1